MRPTPERTRPSTPARASRALTIAAALGAGVLPVSAIAAAPAPPATPAACDTSAVSEPAPLADAMAAAPAPAGVRAAIRDANDLTSRQLSRLAADRSAWVDSCAAVFYVEPVPGVPEEGRPAGRDPRAGAAGPTAAQGLSSEVPDDVLTLSSLPDSDHTIYLDFTGDTVTGTAWNRTYGSVIDAAPYSITTPASTDFTAAERAEIHTAWRTVAEDFAAFDVNVTTREPSTDAVTRSSTADPTYGVRVLVTGGGPIRASCGCGGVAYLDIFGDVGNHYWNPAWVFSDGTTTSGYSIAQAASHEAGHTFGLRHDGTSSRDYYAGAGAYGPIMGASYGRRVSHWSNGEYPGANNVEDDIAVISTLAPALVDDHGDTPADATPITHGETVDGLLAGRVDADAFTFVGEGRVTLAATGPVGVSNADLRLRILDATGGQVALVDPTSTAGSLDATWSASLPAGAGPYTAVVAGAGDGDPGIAGQYSDYGSLGTYSVRLDVAGEPLAARATATTLTGTADEPLPATATVTASGGVAPYTYTAVGLPPGWTMNPSDGHVSGTATRSADASVTVTVTDVDGRTAAASLRAVVEPSPEQPAVPTVVAPAPVVLPADPALDFAGGTFLPATRRGRAYAATITVTGPRVATWTFGGLHGTGLKVSGSGRRARVTGTPRQRGRVRLTVIVRSRDGQSIRRTFTVRVR